MSDVKPRVWTIPRFILDDKSQYGDTVEMRTVILQSAYQSAIAERDALQLSYEASVFEADKFERERDEARAEVGRLSGLPYVRALEREANSLRNMAVLHTTKLAEAYQFLREGKAKFAPNTTNSFVDDWLKWYEAQQ